MKKAAFIISVFRDSNITSGGERVFYELIRRFVENNYLVDIYCDTSYATDLSGINAVHIIKGCCNYKKPHILEAFYDGVKEALKNKDYDYIISNNITPPIDIAFVQGHSFSYYKSKLNLIDALLFGLARSKSMKSQEKYLKQGYRKIFVVSKMLKDDLISNFNIPEDKISVIYPGVETSDNFADFKNDIITFGLCAPSFKNKGGYIFLKTLNILRERGFNFKARIIYSKYKKNFLIKSLMKLYGIEKNVEFISGKVNMQDFYGSIDCLVVPSIIESFSLVALEAMANKKLCIVGSSVGVSEIFKDGYEEFIFDINKKPSQNLAEKMELILNNPEKLQKYSEKGYELAGAYNWDKAYNDFVRELSVL